MRSSTCGGRKFSRAWIGMLRTMPYETSAIATAHANHRGLKMIGLRAQNMDDASVNISHMSTGTPTNTRSGLCLMALSTSA